MSERISHNFDPIYNENSRILILGTFPSVKSRETNFYYGHPQNRFWKLIAALCGEPVPATIPQKKALLLGHGIAVWDVIASCEITGSSDSSIRNVVPNNLDKILKNAPIECICANGGKAFELYRKYCLPVTERECIKLPSTSPANAAWSLERLEKEWGEVFVNSSFKSPVL